jgi:hypothetical protein
MGSCNVSFNSKRSLFLYLGFCGAVAIYFLIQIFTLFISWISRRVVAICFLIQNIHFVYILDFAAGSCNMFFNSKFGLYLYFGPRGWQLRLSRNCPPRVHTDHKMFFNSKRSLCLYLGFRGGQL